MASSAAIRLDRSRLALVTEEAFTKGLPSTVSQEWRSQGLRYAEYWRWIDGLVWEEYDRTAIVEKGQEYPLIFPLQMNPLHTAALLHRNALFGEVPDNGEPMVRTIAMPRRKPGQQEGPEEAAKLSAEKVSMILSMIWEQSNGRSVMLDAGYVSQALGGAVFQVTYEPRNLDLAQGLPVVFRQIEPEFFLPVYSMNNRWDLLEARIGRRIDAYEAKEIYGVAIQGESGFYMEKWTRQRVDVTIDGQPVGLRFVIDGKVIEIPLSNEHGLGFVPFVYIPHDVVGQFYGVPLMHQLPNMLKELNGRAADVGDAMRNAIERIYVVTNADTADLRVKNLGNGIKVIATGREMAGTQGKKIEHVPPPDLPQGTMEFLKFLERQTWHAMFTPSVAYGEDEGSQRSALTLAFRMWPLTSHIRAERSLWNDGLRALSRMALRMLMVKQTAPGFDVSEGTPWRVMPEDLAHSLIFDWAPMIPRDRESDQNLIILRHQEGLLSTETAIVMNGDVQDPKGEVEKINQEKKDEAELEAKYAVKNQPGQPEGAISDKQPPVATVETE
jgi:hypothetical protein